MNTQNLAKLTKWLIFTMRTYMYVASAVFFIMPHMHSSEVTLFNCLNAKELPTQNTPNIWRLCDCNRTWAHNHLAGKRTLNHFVKLTKWLSCVVRFHLYGKMTSFFYQANCMFRVKLHSAITQTIHHKITQSVDYTNKF